MEIEVKNTFVHFGERFLLERSRSAPPEFGVDRIVADASRREAARARKRRSIQNRRANKKAQRVEVEVLQEYVQIRNVELWLHLVQEIVSRADSVTL